MDDIWTWNNLLAFFTLTCLEIVLGIDNIIFIAILSGKAKPEDRVRLRRLGLTLAMGTRILFLISIFWIMKLDQPFYTLPLFGVPLSGKSLILLVGGLFLIFKATREIHEKVESSSSIDPRAEEASRKHASFGSLLGQILALDIVFSIDSVITAVGMADSITVMVAAVIVSVIVMLLYSGWVVRIVERHPSIKMLALSFLLLIGMTLMAEGAGAHVSKGYIYFAMGFSLFVEMLNLRTSRKPTAVAAPPTVVS
ncbi:MAG TPA: TerC family protein [Planctomycetia bacterium]|nr:TerC family protein [Planctomycetia bacterium]